MILLSLLLCVLAAAAASCVSVFVFNKVPATWLCDYDETPDKKLLYEKRAEFKPVGLVLFALFAVFLLLLLHSYGASPLFFSAAAALLPLAWVSWADARYTIIPDQFSLLLAVPALIFRLFCEDFSQPLWALLDILGGAAAGAGLILLMDLFGRLIYHREGMGFGDVKLMAAAGLFPGLKYVLALFVIIMLVGFAHIIYLALRRKLSEENIYIPFGPYICLGAALFTVLLPQLKSIASLYTFNLS